MNDKPREVTGRLVKRLYEHSLKTTGRLPNSKEVRSMEKKAAETAVRAERDKKN